MEAIRHKGKFISQKQLNKKQNVKLASTKRKKVLENVDNPTFSALKGARIIDWKIFVEQMYCSFCNRELYVHQIKEEFRQGLGSILKVQCVDCLAISEVYTGRTHKTPTGRTLFDINSKAVLGALHTGGGHTTVNKQFAVMDIPFMCANTFKLYENEVGPAAETVAKRSCLDAAKKERDLVIANRHLLEKLLPQNLRSDFLVLCKSEDNISDTSEAMEESITLSDSSANVNSPDQIEETSNSSASSSASNDTMSENMVDSCENSSTSDLTSRPNSTISHSTSDIPRVDINSDEDNQKIQSYLVRLLAAFDMGHSKRGNGRQYDSLNGYLAMIGVLSGLVIDFITRNRKCRLCDLGHPKTDHDCRLNFFGSAKAMEADAAQELAVNSTILKEVDAQLGVFVGDNDSASILAIRNASDHTIVKHADKNHTSKGVKKALYKIQPNSNLQNELNNESINYIHRCFTYALAQNKGNLEGLQAALKNIPYHAFNDHKNCGNWCGYVKDPDHYDHKTIPGGFHDPVLFVELQKLFDSLAASAENFFACASSQANESLNAVMARKCPKAICYSLGPSADYRFACSVCQKNLNEQYLVEILKELGLDVGVFLQTHVKRTELIHKQKIAISKTVKFKAQRRLLQKYRTQLKYRKEKIEGTMYESDMCLLKSSAPKKKDVGEQNLPVLANPFKDEDHAVVFFDLETSGLSGNCDILQIALKANSVDFNEYIYPTQPIPTKATDVNGISNIEGQLFLHGEPIQSSPLRIVLLRVLEFLTKLEKTCILVAHNGHSFDVPRLMRVIEILNLQSEFGDVITSFVDSMELFKKIMPERKNKPNGFKLTTLAVDTLGLPIDGAHDANYDVYLLEQLVFKHFKFQDLIQNQRTYSSVLQSRKDAVRSKEVLQTLGPLDKVISKLMKNRLAEADITYQLLLETFQKGEDELILLLKKKFKDKKHLITSKKIINAIAEHCQKIINSD